LDNVAKCLYPEGPYFLLIKFIFGTWAMCTSTSNKN